jgi:phosphopentomutase
MKTGKAILIVLDSVGAGALPDAADYGDAGSNTLSHIAQSAGLRLPNMIKLGLGNIPGLEELQKTKLPAGCFGKLAEKSKGKDTTTGHWEIAGLTVKNPFPTFPNGFPKEVIASFEREIGRKTIGNIVASGTEIIEKLGEEHVRTGYPIVYTSADSVFQIAAHEQVIPLGELYEICETARRVMSGPYAVGRIIARPFEGEAGNFTRTKNRKDYSVVPFTDTLLDVLSAAGYETCAVGKIEDIFAHKGITKVNHALGNPACIDATLAFQKQPFSGLVFTNLVDFDMLYGHRNDVTGYAAALEYFDSRLPEIISLMKDEDMLFITADHGCDPTTASTDHSREYIPLVACGKSVRAGVNIGVRASFADIAATIAEWFELPERFGAESFLSKIKK